MSDVSVESWSKLVPPIFARCVDPDNHRFDLSMPFVVGEHLYATDAMIAVRMLTPPHWDIPNPLKTQTKAPTVFTPDGKERVSVELPEVEETCSWCQGMGISPPTRCQCRDCGCEIDLPERPCDRCGGSKVEDHLERLEVVPGYWVGRGYAAILREHDVLSISIPADKSHLTPARFSLREVEGVLMPMKPPKPGEEA